MVRGAVCDTDSLPSSAGCDPSIHSLQHRDTRTWTVHCSRLGQTTYIHAWQAKQPFLVRPPSAAGVDHPAPNGPAGVVYGHLFLPTFCGLMLPAALVPWCPCFFRSEASRDETRPGPIACMRRLLALGTGEVSGSCWVIIDQYLPLHF